MALTGWGAVTLATITATKGEGRPGKACLTKRLGQVICMAAQKIERLGPFYREVNRNAVGDVLHIKAQRSKVFGGKGQRDRPLRWGLNQQDQLIRQGRALWGRRGRGKHHLWQISTRCNGRGRALLRDGLLRRHGQRIGYDFDSLGHVRDVFWQACIRGGYPCHRRRGVIRL